MNSILLKKGWIYSFLFCLVFTACQPSTDSNNDSSNEGIQMIDSPLHFQEGYSILNRKGKHVFIDQYGKTPEALSYDNIAQKLGNGFSSLDHFHDGLATAFLKNNRGQTSWVYLNTKGENAFGKAFDYAGDFEDGKAIVKENGQWGIIDKKGKFIIPNQYEGVSKISQSNNLWIKKEGAWQYVSYPELKPLLNGEYKIYGEDEEGTFWVEAMNENPDTVLRAYVNSLGQIISPWFSNATDFSEGLAAFEKDKKWGHIDLKGDIAIEPSFDYSSNFSEGFARITTIKDDNEFQKWGYINKKGKTVIPMQFDFVRDFKNGYAEVKDSSGYIGFINTSGKVVVNYEYDTAYNFHENLVAVKKDEKWGFVNKRGDVVIPLRFDKVSTFVGVPFDGGFSGGIAKVEVDGHEFFINKEGNCALGCLE